MRSRFALVSLIIAGVFFAVIAPTLVWLEFSSGSENLVAETVLEMRRGGPWLIPELAGAPRTRKPPLPAWISAAFVRPATIAALSQAQGRAARDAAYRRLAWQVRWPALVFAALTIVVAAWLGRLLLSAAGGVVTAVMLASTLLLLRFGRTMTTDIQLALWVALANLFFAMAILNQRRALSCLLGGIALGVALMTKGPVALAQTVVPLLVFVAWRRWNGRPVRIAWPAVASASALALAIALPWPIWAASQLSGQASLWFSEVAAGGARSNPYDPPWVYFAFIPLLLPWAGFFILGMVALWREKSERGLLAIAFTFVPIAMMCLFPQKSDRYLLPMVAPAAVICAAGFLSRDAALDGLRGVVNIFTWGFLLVLGIGLPLSGVWWQRGIDGRPWFSLAMGMGAAAILGLIIVGGWWIDSSGRRTLLPVGAAVMLIANTLFTLGYANTDRGRSDGRPIAEFVVAALPADAPVWVFAEEGRFSRAPVDTAIYLNRVVEPIHDLSKLPPTAGPLAVLVHCKANQSMPAALSGWPVIGSSPKNQGVWRVCVRGGQ
jgi:4-amino-4-deoxy-L-arabinose transferase-like glycosyltransferase